MIFSILLITILILKFGICQQCDQIDGHGVEVCWNNIKEIQQSDGKGIYECLSNSENCIPGARSQYSIFKSLNNENEFYIFGGEGYDSNKHRGLSNDLWKGSISSEGNMIYSFIDGSKTNDIDIFSSNGTINEYLDDNIIGQRKSSGSFRTENDLCIFGGYGNPNLNEALNQGSLGDFYCYGINEKSWKFLGGRTNTNSGQFYKGNDFPGQRFDSNTWSYQKEDGNWYFYLFGGMTNNYFQGVDASISIFDFWRYDVSKGEWKLMIDTNLFSNDIYLPNSYDYIYDSFNRLARPPVTAGGITFQNGNSLFLFGGSANNENTKLYNDLWEYSIIKEMWRHVSGNKELNGVASGNYDGESQIPGGRKYGSGEIFENSFYLFGGNGRDNEGIVGVLKDTWKFNFKNGEWKYLDILPIGDSIDPTIRNGNGRYESEGDPEYFYPRMGMQSTIIDRKLYFFGGENNGGEFFQDTWNLLIEYECYGFTMSDSEVCNRNGVCVGSDLCSCNLGYYGDQCEKKISEGGDNSQSTTDELVVIPMTLIAINIVFVVIFLLIIGGLIIFVLLRTGKLKIIFSKENIEEEIIKEEKEEEIDNKKSKKSKKSKKKKKKKEEEESFGVARLSFL